MLLLAAIVLADLNQWTWIDGHSDVTDTDPQYGTLGEANVTTPEQDSTRPPLCISNIYTSMQDG